MLLVAPKPTPGDEGDLAYRDGALIEDAAILTAAYLSLFTDAPARDGDPVPEGSERRGYWGDAFDAAQDGWGSRLWLVAHMTPPEALSFAPEAAKEALQWMVRDGLAAAIEATAERVAGHVRLEVTITRPDEIAPPLVSAWNLETS